jgi:hypothetical protein
LNCAKVPVTTRLLSNTSERDKARDQVGDVTWSLYFFVYVVYTDDLYLYYKPFGTIGFEIIHTEVVFAE